MKKTYYLNVYCDTSMVVFPTKEAADQMSRFRVKYTTKTVDIPSKQKIKRKSSK